MADSEDWLPMGRVSGLFGVRGWVRVYSYTEPRDNLLNYTPWYLRRDGGPWREVEPLGGKLQGKGLVAHLKGYDDRDAAATLMGSEIAIRFEQLPEPAEDEFYWAELIGLAVRTTQGADLGTVIDLMETGANDVLVVRGERERLIPFTPGLAVSDVDLEAGLITVDWDPDF